MFERWHMFPRKSLFAEWAILRRAKRHGLREPYLRNWLLLRKPQFLSRRRKSRLRQRLFL